MGLFLSVLGVIGASCSEVQGALTEFKPADGGGFELGTTDDLGALLIAKDGPNTTVRLPESFYEWDEVAGMVSARLEKPAFSFHIHDGDLWMYRLFNNGQAIDSFNPLPDYWKEVSDEEKAKWRGNASAVAGQIPGLSPGAISKYLVSWSEDGAHMGKAYPDDEYEIGDCWQMVDFMKRVGLRYPTDEDVSALMYRAKRESQEAANPARTIPQQRIPSTGQQKKPWWRFWQ